MDKDLVETVRLAMQESWSARNLFTEAMHKMSEKLGYTKVEERDRSDVQVFGAPATEESIAKLEAVIKMKLPASYRAFLSLSDGWKVVDGSQSFFSVDEILEWRARRDPSGWMSIAKQAGNHFVEDCLVVGASDDAPGKYLLNPNKIKAGEWEFIDYGKNEFLIFDSFIDFLLDTKHQFLEASKELDFGEYYDPFEEE